MEEVEGRELNLGGITREKVVRWMGERGGKDDGGGELSNGGGGDK
jgi:hypothetical protein